MANAVFLDGHAESCNAARLGEMSNENEDPTAAPTGYGISQFWDLNGNYLDNP